MTNIFVGNLDPNATEEQVRTLFKAYGAVVSVTIVRDRDTGRPRGFAFVEMTEPVEAQAAISSLKGTLLNDRLISVNEARPKLRVDDLTRKSSGTRDHRHHHI